uniref:Uncharacterized protein n=1 Tax=Moniliophthora roreri TaxID=221103 RepID=A0A0W0FI98_MONRR
MSAQKSTLSPVLLFGTGVDGQS